MRVLLINGSPNTNGNTAAALAVVQERLHKDGLETEWLQLEKKPVRGCADCNGCVGTNRCVFHNDLCNQMIESILAADGIIIGSPVYFAGPNGSLCALLDRVFYATCTRSQLFAGKPAGALVTCAGSGGTASLDRLHRYFVPCQMPIVTSCDYTVFIGDSVKRHEPRSIGLLETLADNMSKLLGNTGVLSHD